MRREAGRECETPEGEAKMSDESSQKKTKAKENRSSEEKKTKDDVRLKALFARGDMQIAHKKSMFRCFQQCP